MERKTIIVILLIISILLSLSIAVFKIRETKEVKKVGLEEAMTLMRNCKVKTLIDAHPDHADSLTLLDGSYIILEKGVSSNQEFYDLYMDPAYKTKCGFNVNSAIE